MPLKDDNETLSAFRGLDFQPPLYIKHVTKGKVVPIAELTEAFLKKFELQKAITDLRHIISDNWSGCVDANIVDKCSPQNVRLNVLYVSACNSTVRQEIVFSEKLILQKIRRLDGCAKIRKIRVL